MAQAHEIVVERPDKKCATAKNKVPSIEPKNG